MTIRKSRPGEGAAYFPANNSQQSRTVGAQLRERRTAALRLEPLENGFRDPLDDIPPMSEASLRAFCNELHRMGFSVDYLVARYGVEPVGAR